jgi:S1-C subfamily serine protease
VKKANIALGILASIPFIALIILGCAVGYFSKSRITHRALGGPRAIVQVDESYLRRGFIGIQFESVLEADAERIGIKGGVMVTSVIAESPADLSGIAVGDYLVAVDGNPIDSKLDFSSECVFWKSDQVDKLTVVRDVADTPVERIVECRLISFDDMQELMADSVDFP